MIERNLLRTTVRDEAEAGFDLREALGFVWRQWKFVVAITALICAVGLVMVLQKTPLYTATTQVLLDQQQQPPSGQQIGLVPSTLDLTAINSQMAIIRSTAFLRRVVERNHLISDPLFAGHSAPTSPSVWASITSSISSLLPSAASFPETQPRSGDATPTDPTPGGDRDDAIPANELPVVRALSSGLKVTRSEGDGNVLTISYTSPDPAQSARLSNEIAAAYLVDKLDARLEAANRATAWLGDRLVALQQQAHDSEEAVENFRAAHGLTQAAAGVTLTQAQLSQLNADLVSAKADLAQKKAQVDLLESISARGGSIQNFPAITNAGALPALRSQESTLSEEEAKLLTRYDKSYPLVVNVDAQLRDVQRSIAAETDRLAAGIRNDYAVAQARVASLQTSLKAATGQTNVDDATAVQLHELERTAEVNKTLFEDYLKDSKVSQADATFQPQDARIIAPALIPSVPSAPQKTRFMSVTLFIGLLTGVGGAFAKEKLRSHDRRR
jgi:succinoglycan biosynthesis transport protein ExoP